VVFRAAQQPLNRCVAVKPIRAIDRRESDRAVEDLPKQFTPVLNIRRQHRAPILEAPTYQRVTKRKYFFIDKFPENAVRFPVTTRKDKNRPSSRHSR
jgi:hypothetical protein